MKAHTKFLNMGYLKCKPKFVTPLFIILIAGSLVLMGEMTADNIGYSQTMAPNSNNQTNISSQSEQENLTSVTNDTQSSNMSGILSNSSVIGENASLNPQVKIISHSKGQEVPVGTLSVNGISSDNSASACDVYVLLNGIKPYQKVTPIGQSGSNNGNKDYSLWNFTFLPTYGLITEGDNKMTAKITCITGSENATKFNSLNVTGVASNNSNSNISTVETADSLKNTSENVANNSTFGPPNSNSTYIKSTSVIPQQSPAIEGVTPR
ncbi:MAG TPA: hypothetical protein VE130_15870, partial [Nitrososphaeraceae archaeon]|nr:hypothetical protein [Nitrososphaeraceae archaeon]